MQNDAKEKSLFLFLNAFNTLIAVKFTRQSPLHSTAPVVVEQAIFNARHSNRLFSYYEKKSPRRVNASRSSILFADSIAIALGFFSLPIILSLLTQNPYLWEAKCSKVAMKGFCFRYYFKRNFSSSLKGRSAFFLSKLLY